jgi:hypothetical protein
MYLFDSRTLFVPVNIRRAIKQGTSFLIILEVLPINKGLNMPAPTKIPNF